METIKHLMWQPTFSCKIKCKDCYVNKCKDKSKLISNNHIGVIEDLLLENDVYQFTISIDKDITNRLKNDIYRLIRVYDFLEESPKKNIWLTFHSVTNCIEFFDKIINSNDENYITPLISGISISSLIGDLDFLCNNICKKYSIRLNLNLLINDEYNLVQDFLFCEGIDIVDSVYVICKKEPFGSPHESLVKSANECTKAYNDLNRYFPNKSIYLDNCLQCVLSTNTAKDCNSDITHLWPNNVRTKCPYNVNQLPNDNFNNCLFKELKCQ